MLKKLNIALFLLGSVMLTNCVDDPVYNDIPEIDYNGVSHTWTVDSTGKKVDNVTVRFLFRDGDGDLGESIDERDTLRYGEWGSCELTTVRLNKDGSWTEAILPKDKYIWLPKLSTDSLPTPITGIQSANTAFVYDSSYAFTTVKFKVRIRDRALNVSNTIESDTISVPGYK